MSAAACNPIVLIGMHRSGTSMVIRMLQQMGVFIGWELDANGEAVYFVRRNRAILEAQGARWDRPAPIDELLDHEPLRRRLVQTLAGELSTPGVASYLGPGRYLRYRSLERFDRPWAWKDPRNTLLLRPWMEVFPAAKVVHVVRNGVDVALSLARREARRLDYVLGEEAGVGSFLGLLASPPEGCSRSAWAFSQIRLRTATKERLARRFLQLRVHPSIDPARGFELWEEYLSRAEANARYVGEDMLQLRYEDVLRDPAGAAHHLATFCGIDAAPQRLAAAAAAVDASRGGRPRSGAATTSLLERARGNERLRDLGYTESFAGSGEG